MERRLWAPATALVCGGKRGKGDDAVVDPLGTEGEWLCRAAAARDGAPSAAPRRPPPGLRGVWRAKGGRALPDRLLARLHGVPP